MDDVEEIKRLLGQCRPEQREEIFRFLRAEFRIHPLEEELGTQAEVILEAISRGARLTLRMIRGVIAEAAFDVEVVEKLKGWTKVAPEGERPYDFLLRDDQGDVRVQVKLQRSLKGVPMLANEASRSFPEDMYVVETQKTRAGRTRKGVSTRPYRFGEFDILAASMYPSTHQWNRFMYTVSDWLLAEKGKKKQLMKFQPVPRQPNEDWTDDFQTVVSWFRSGVKKKIRGK